MKQIAKQKAKEERKKLEAEVRVVRFEHIRASLYHELCDPSVVKCYLLIFFMLHVYRIWFYAHFVIGPMLLFLAVMY